MKKKNDQWLVTAQQFVIGADLARRVRLVTPREYLREILIHAKEVDTRLAVFACHNDKLTPRGAKDSLAYSLALADLQERNSMLLKSIRDKLTLYSEPTARNVFPGELIAAQTAWLHALRATAESLAKHRPRFSIPVSDADTLKASLSALIDSLSEDDSGEGKSATIVHVDMQIHEIMIAGRAVGKVSPHHAVIVNALVKSKSNGEPYITGAKLRGLPGCLGKNISREIGKIKNAVSALAKIIDSNDNGYFLTR